MAKQDRGKPGHEPLTDPSEFDHVMELIHEFNKHPQYSHRELKSLLGMLIEDTITELEKPNSNLVGARAIGDFDDAYGAHKLLTDYGHLNTNEEAAANLLFTLHIAHSEVSETTPLDEARINAIKQEVKTLILWRLHSKHMELETRNKKARIAPIKANAKRNQKLAETAIKLLEHGCTPRELVRRMIESGTAEDLSDDALRSVLQTHGVLPKPKKRAPKKPKTE